MRRDAARRLAKHEFLWTEIVGKLRRGGLDRRASYRLCQDAIKGVGSSGIGPAYFIKLIFFANPAHDGYIMDQWTSRSIKFLIDGPPVVKMRIKNHVDPRNNEAVYENFCCAVEALTKALHKVSLEETELYQRRRLLTHSGFLGFPTGRRSVSMAGKGVSDACQSHPSL